MPRFACGPREAAPDRTIGRRPSAFRRRPLPCRRGPLPAPDGHFLAVAGHSLAVAATSCCSTATARPVTPLLVCQRAATCELVATKGCTWASPITRSTSVSTTAAQLTRLGCAHDRPLKLLALLPHAIILIFLDIAQMAVAFVAQLVVAVTGEYPPRMFAFVAGVLRWNTRVSAFVLSSPTAIRRSRSTPGLPGRSRHRAACAQQSPLMALFIALVEVVFAAALIALFVHFIGDASEAPRPRRSAEAPGTRSDPALPSGSTRPPGDRPAPPAVAALPHLIVLGILGIVAFFIWFVVQWVDLFRAVTRGACSTSPRASCARQVGRAETATRWIEPLLLLFTFQPSRMRRGSRSAPRHTRPRRVVSGPFRSPRVSVLGWRGLDAARGRQRADRLRPS